MKIAGVSIKESNPPKREVIVKLALNTERFRFKRNALELINKEIDDSKLFAKSKPKARKEQSGKTNNKGGKKTIELDKGDDTEEVVTG